MLTKTLLQSESTRNAFRGFEHPNANFLFCPNQFFDVCLPHCSRGAVRFVAYLLRRTLGWRDENGNPIEHKITIPHEDFIARAGISKGAIASVSDEVISRGFAYCTQVGRAKAKGRPARSAEYELLWDERGDYHTDVHSFQGFYAGGGNCSPIPNSFFDHIVPDQRLAIIKVVGTVLRYTVGFEGKYGGRCDQASLSLSFIQRYANIKDRKVAISALNDSREGNFIRRVEEGGVHKAATYSPTWLRREASDTVGSKNPPVSVQKTHQGEMSGYRFKKPTSIGSKNPPPNQFKKPTTIKTSNKNTFKQQTAAESLKLIELLEREGFDRTAAEELISIASANEIQNQIAWIDFRHPKNRLGMLRTAIQEKWSAPTGAKEAVTLQRSRKQQQEQEAIHAATDAAIAEEVRRHNERRKTLLMQWNNYGTTERQQFHNDAIKQSHSAFDQTTLRRHTDLHNPPMATLEAMARAHPLAMSS